MIKRLLSRRKDREKEKEKVRNRAAGAVGKGGLIQT